MRHHSLNLLEAEHVGFPIAILLEIHLSTFYLIASVKKLVTESIKSKVMPNNNYQLW